MLINRLKVEGSREQGWFVMELTIARDDVKWWPLGKFQTKVRAQKEQARITKGYYKAHGVNPFYEV